MSPSETVWRLIDWTLFNLILVHFHLIEICLIFTFFETDKSNLKREIARMSDTCLTNLFVFHELDENDIKINTTV